MGVDGVGRDLVRCDPAIPSLRLNFVHGRSIILTKAINPVAFLQDENSAAPDIELFKAARAGDGNPFGVDDRRDFEPVKEIGAALRPVQKVLWPRRR
jgi:hypothetical protein